MHGYFKMRDGLQIKVKECIATYFMCRVKCDRKKCMPIVHFKIQS